MKIILLIIFAIGMVSLAGIQYSYASCTATIIPEPCFDSYSGSSLPLTENSMIGLCSKCYTSGVSLVLHEETSEAVCDICRN